MVPTKRCQPVNAMVAPDGAPCTLRSMCAGGFCLPGPDQKLTCASVCRADGATCTERADCCDPLSNDCLSVGGVPTCVAIH
jgi:hypothetical protein